MGIGTVEPRAPVDTPTVPLLTLDEVRRRMAALDAELVRLARDPDVAARAFHTQVAELALTALRADEVRLLAIPILDVTPVPAVAFAPEVRAEDGAWVATTATRRWEILDC